MKRAILTVLAVAWGYLEFRADANFWLPAVGAISSGYALAQIIVLAVLAAMIFGTAISLGYRFLNFILD